MDMDAFTWVTLPQDNVGHDGGECAYSDSTDTGKIISSVILLKLQPGGSTDTEMGAMGWKGNRLPQVPA